MTRDTLRDHAAEAVDAETAPHEHAWCTLSSHPTSEGLVLYVRCAGCGALRVDVRGDAPVPSALSRATPAR